MRQQLLILFGLPMLNKIANFAMIHVLKQVGFFTYPRLLIFRFTSDIIIH
jgi:hypothetical protein